MMDDLTRKMGKVTAMGRMVDPRYPSNRFIMIAAPIFSIIAGIMGLAQGPLQALLQAVLMGLLVFGVWALGRELDPDQPMAANVAAIVAPIVALATQIDGLLLLFGVMLLVRIVNRTTGLPAYLLDTLSIVIIIGAVALLFGVWPLLIVGGIAFLLDATLQDALKRHYAAAAMMVALMGVYIIMRGFPALQPAVGLWLGVLAFVTTTLTLLGIATLPPVEATGDRTGQRLNTERVKWGIGLVLLTALLTLWYGPIAHLSLWLTLLVAGLFYLRGLIPQRSE